ncbi:hypothetical protein V1477_000551 [Vespula maculifrons]|uniref:Uncharacterized protein n=1 Tax=Vespula maculifrons TaxID=7453 RepID=A0ABD2D1X2_VESMC
MVERMVERMAEDERGCIPSRTTSTMTLFEGRKAIGSQGYWFNTQRRTLWVLDTILWRKGILLTLKTHNTEEEEGAVAGYITGCRCDSSLKIKWLILNQIVTFIDGNILVTSLIARDKSRSTEVPEAGWVGCALGNEREIILKRTMAKVEEE